MNLILHFFPQLVHGLLAGAATTKKSILLIELMIQSCRVFRRDTISDKPVKSAAPVATVEHCKVKREKNEIFDLKDNNRYEHDGIEHVKVLRVFSNDQANGAKAAQSCLQVDRAMNPLVKGKHIHSLSNTKQINYAHIKEIEVDVKSVVDNFVADNKCCKANTLDCCNRSSETVVINLPTITKGAVPPCVPSARQPSLSPTPRFARRPLPPPPPAPRFARRPPPPYVKTSF